MNIFYDKIIDKITQLSKKIENIKNKNDKALFLHVKNIDAYKTMSPFSWMLVKDIENYISLSFLCDNIEAFTLDYKDICKKNDMWIIHLLEKIFEKNLDEKHVWKILDILKIDLSLFSVETKNKILDIYIKNNNNISFDYIIKYILNTPIFEKYSSKIITCGIKNNYVFDYKFIKNYISQEQACVMYIKQNIKNIPEEYIYLCIDEILLSDKVFNLSNTSSKIQRAFADKILNLPLHTKNINKIKFLINSMNIENIEYIEKNIKSNLINFILDKKTVIDIDNVIYISINYYYEYINSKKDLIDFSKKLYAFQLRKYETFKNIDNDIKEDNLLKSTTFRLLSNIFDILDDMEKDDEAQAFIEDILNANPFYINVLHLYTGNIIYRKHLQKFIAKWILQCNNITLKYLDKKSLVLQLLYTNIYVDKNIYNILYMYYIDVFGKEILEQYFLDYLQNKGCNT